MRRNFTEPKPKPPPHGILQLLGLMDDVDERTDECYRASRSRFLNCCSTDQPQSMLGPDGFSLVPGWTSLADRDGTMEVLEKRHVALVTDALRPVDVDGRRRYSATPTPAPSSATPSKKTEAETPSTTLDTSTTLEDSTISSSPEPSILASSPPKEEAPPAGIGSTLPAPSTPVRVAPAAASPCSPPPPPSAKQRQRRAAPKQVWVQDVETPDEPPPRAPVGAQVKPPPEQLSAGWVPPPSPMAMSLKEEKALEGKRPPISDPSFGHTPEGFKLEAAASPDEEGPARQPSRSRPQSKSVRYLSGPGKGKRHSSRSPALDDLTKHLVGCHERDKLKHWPAEEHRSVPTSEICVKGAISEGCGVVRVKTEHHRDVYLTYRPTTARWLVVHSTDPAVPLGSTGDYPDSTSKLLQYGELRLSRPSWEPVLREEEVASALAAAERSAQSAAEGLVQGATASKQLVLLFGPPGSGKTTAALAKPELSYSSSVRLIQDDYIRDCCVPLFKKLVEGYSLAQVDANEKEAFLIESLRLYNRFTDLASRVLWKGEHNAFHEALRRGVGIIVENIGASLTTLKPAVEAARSHGYRVTALFCQAPGSELRRRCEKRIEKELTTGVMLGGRRFDAFLDHLADAAAEAWPDLAALCDEARIVRFVEQEQQQGEVVLRGQSTERAGVIQVLTAQKREVHLAYRAATGRWLVVFSTAEDVPLGCTAGYPDSTAALLGRTELRLRRPSWKAVLSKEEVAASVRAAKARLPQILDGLLAGTSAPKQLALLFGPPDCGKTTLAHEMPELHYGSSAHLVQDEVIRECSSELFEKLVAGWPSARTEPLDKEAFLVEALNLYNSFSDMAQQAIWRGKNDNGLLRAVKLGVGVVAESVGPSLEGLKPMATVAREHGYNIIGIFPTAPARELRRRAEERFDRELDAGRMLGGRHFDAYVDLLTDVAEQAWPEIKPLCDEAQVIEGHAGPARMPAPRDSERSNTGQLISPEQTATATATEAASAHASPHGSTMEEVQERESSIITPRSLPTQGREHVDFEMVLSDLDQVEALAYSEAFAILEGAEATDNPVLREFVQLNSCIRPEDLDAKLAQIAPDKRMTPARLVELLRNHACDEEPALKHFLEASPDGKVATTSACRKAMPLLANGVRGSFIPGARRLTKERWDRVLDSVIGNSGNTVDQQQWLEYWKTIARILRLLHWAKL